MFFCLTNICLKGVLQALGVAYFAVAMANSASPPAAKQPIRHIRSHFLLGFLPLVAANLIVTFVLHVPGCPTGYLGPGGFADGGKYQNCTGSAHLYVDSLVFGRNHLLQSPTCQKVYQTGAFDPEGVLNWLMVAATAYLGYIAAALMVATRPAGSKHNMRALVTLGMGLLVASVAAGGLLVAHKPWVPLNKNLWSVSYMLLSTGLACLLHALLLFVVDTPGRVAWRSCGWPLVCVGKNPIFLYVMVSQLVRQ